jgi:catechol 2,3-dioxygenase-like lactoylglutathione lyase family enzyme
MSNQKCCISNMSRNDIPEDPMIGESPVLELRVVLTVADLDAAIRLYRDGLGLALVRTFDGGAILSAGGVGIELLSEAEAARVDAIEGGAIASGPARLAIQVPDSEKAAKALLDAGASGTAVPVNTPWGHRSVRLRTPDGLAITLFTAPGG